jgi:hypothetical protein
VNIRIAFFASLVLCFAALAPAPAQSLDAEAKQHFDEGSKAFNLGEFNRAVDEYKLAYRAKPDPVFLYNIAQSYRLANDLNQALFFYRSFIRNMPNAPNRREVEDRIRKLEVQINQLAAPPNNPLPPKPERPASTAPAPAATAATAPAPVPKPAPPTMRVETPPPAPKPAPPTMRVETPPPAPKPAPAPAPAPAVAAQPAAPPAAVVQTAPSSAPTPVYKKWWLWTIVGVVVVGAAVGAGVGVASSGGNSAPGSHFGTASIF